jgi:hypothetical protein
VIGKGYDDLVASRRLFLTNRDLPKRLELAVELNMYNRVVVIFYAAHSRNKKQELFCRRLEKTTQKC